MRRSPAPSWRLASALVATAALLTGCASGASQTDASGSPTDASGSPTAAPATQAPSDEAGLTIVVLGDSIPFNAPEDCPGCTGFADSYAAAIGDAEGVAVDVRNLSRHDGARVADILDQVASGTVDDALAAADTVILSAGFNDQPPYWQAGAPCAGEVETDEQAVDLVIATTPTCVADATAALRADYTELLAGIRDLAPEADLMTLTAYNSWTGWAPLDARSPEESAAAQDVVVSALEQWRDAVCDAAGAVDGTCVDLLEPFNGADGRTAAGELLADDYTHPSQLGNDVIREALLAAAGR